MSGIWFLAGLCAAAGDVFEKPVALMAAGAPIEGHVGHLAPFVCDWDGDRVRDLLVGQFGGGQLAVYANAGTETEPDFEAAQWFQAGGTIGRIPAG